MAYFFVFFLLTIFSPLPSYAQSLEKKMGILQNTPYAQIDIKQTYEAFNVLRNGDEASIHKKVEEIVNHPENFSPTVFYELAWMLFEQGQKDDAVRWFYAGFLRSKFDANLCTDESVQDFISELTLSIGREIIRYSSQDSKKFEQTVKEVLEWDLATPFNYDHRWINLYGMKAQTYLQEVQKGKKPEKDIVMSAPKSKWEEIHRKTREEFLTDIKNLQSTIQSIIKSEGENINDSH